MTGLFYVQHTVFRTFREEEMVSLYALEAEEPSRIVPQSHLSKYLDTDRGSQCTI